jgi:hypothetical protein
MAGFKFTSMTDREFDRIIDFRINNAI